MAIERHVRRFRNGRNPERVATVGEDAVCTSIVVASELRLPYSRLSSLSPHRAAVRWLAVNA